MIFGLLVGFGLGWFAYKHRDSFSDFPEKLNKFLDE